MSNLLYKTAILIPLYNNYIYLRKCLESIDIENLNAYLIILNDCSTENVEEILFKFFEKYNKYPIIIDEKNHKIENNIKNKIHYLKHFEKNEHICITRLDLIYYSNKLGLEWVGWCDPDDYVDRGYYNELISYQKECLEKGYKCINCLYNEDEHNIYCKWHMFIKCFKLDYLYEKLKDIELYKFYCDSGEDFMIFQLIENNIYDVKNKLKYHRINNPKSICHTFSINNRFKFDYINYIKNKRDMFRKYIHKLN